MLGREGMIGRLLEQDDDPALIENGRTVWRRQLWRCWWERKEYTPYSFPWGVRFSHLMTRPFRRILSRNGTVAGWLAGADGGMGAARER